MKWSMEMLHVVGKVKKKFHNKKIDFNFFHDAHEKYWKKHNLGIFQECTQ